MSNSETDTKQDQQQIRSARSDLVRGISDLCLCKRCALAAWLRQGTVEQGYKDEPDKLTQSRRVCLCTCLNLSTFGDGEVVSECDRFTPL